MKGEVLGIDHDCSSLGGNRDEFELYIRGSINKSLGTVFAAPNIKISFPVIAEKEICEIEVERGNQRKFFAKIASEQVKYDIVKDYATLMNIVK